MTLHSHKDFLERMSYIRSLEQGWDGHGADPVDRELLDLVVSMVIKHYPETAPAFCVFPNLEAGVELEWFNLQPFAPTLAFDPKNGDAWWHNISLADDNHCEERTLKGDEEESWRWVVDRVLELVPSWQTETVLPLS